MGDGLGPNGRKLVLLVDNDVEARREVRHLLERRGRDVVQASNGLAALELIQRLPESFVLVVTDLDLPGIPGSVLIEVLRLFRPDLPVLCLSTSRATPEASALKRCLLKPVQGGELDAFLDEVAGDWTPQSLLEFPQSVLSRARARFAVGGDLVEAALELSSGGAATNEAG